MSATFEPDDVEWDGDGLCPAIVQEVRTGKVLMLAWMNEESLERTRATGQVHFWSRSREELWHKGETSGNVQRVREMRLDCDGDAILCRVEAAGPACHTGTETCWGDDVPGPVLRELEGVLQRRAAERPHGSYTARLLEAGIDRILRKVGEESTETVIAAKNDDRAELIRETADLLYHVLVLLVAKGISLDAVEGELRARRG